MLFTHSCYFKPFPKTHIFLFFVFLPKRAWKNQPPDRLTLNTFPRTFSSFPVAASGGVVCGFQMISPSEYFEGSSSSSIFDTEREEGQANEVDDMSWFTHHVKLSQFMTQVRFSDPFKKYCIFLSLVKFFLTQVKKIDSIWVKRRPKRWDNLFLPIIMRSRENWDKCKW